MGHRSVSALSLTLRAEARFPASPPLASQAFAPTGTAQSMARQQETLARRNGPLTLGGRADRFYRPLVAPKHCRWGYTPWQDVPTVPAERT